MSVVCVVCCQVEVWMSVWCVCCQVEVWMSVCCECCVLLGRVLFDELITNPEEFYRMWCV
jgi:hypothetical protein